MKRIAAGPSFSQQNSGLPAVGSESPPVADPDFLVEIEATAVLE